jgi:Sulfatase
VAPHFPLIAPQRYIDMYPAERMPLPKLLPQDGYARHPWLAAQEGYLPTDIEFGADDAKRRGAVSAYYALCTMLDEHVGAICAALDETGLAETTSVIYASDHGEALGQRGHWGKSNLYGECTQVPLVAVGPDLPAGRVCDTPVNLVDLAPTFLTAFGLADQSLPGRSLVDIAREPFDAMRASFSEYHAVVAPSGAFMLRKGTGSTTSTSAMRPSSSISSPIRTRRRTRQAIGHARPSSPSCAANCGGSSIPKQRIGRPRPTKGRWWSDLAGARSRSGWGPRARRRRPVGNAARSASLRNHRGEGTTPTSQDRRSSSGWRPPAR